MEAVVSDILQSRKREPGGLKKTAAISLAAHAAAIAVLLMIPSVMPRAAQQPRVIMNISLGGSPGPKTGGMQMIGGTADSGRAAIDRSADRKEHTALSGGNAAEDGAAGSETEAAHAAEADCGV